MTLGLGFAELTLTYELNSEGYRDREFERSGATAAGRVIMLGDSFTFGQGVPVDETLPRVTEALLRARGETGARVWNIGRQGWNTRAQVDAYLKLGARVRHSPVVLVYTYNDIDLRSFGPRDPRLLWFMQKWRTGHLIASAFHGYVDPTYASYWETTERAYRSSDSAEWQQVSTAIAELRDACRANGADLMIYYYELLAEGTDARRWLAHEKVKALAATLEVPFRSFPPLPKDTDLRAWYVHSLDPHPNGMAHHRAAAVIVDYLATRRR